ncbi:MAG: glycosyltransferase, partial [Candidatus Saganbacteria bacterium]|nr:glycosyltransferase [Candidatus Saganbacteria bacterium]
MPSSCRTLMKIPRYIHQTWKTTEIPAEMTGCVESWKKLNPGWKHILWTDSTMDAFVKERFPMYYPFYKSYLSGIFRADLFRLLVIYELGGVYADLDMECLKSLDYLFDRYAKESELVLSYRHPLQSKMVWGTYPLFHFEFAAAIPRNDIVEKIIKQIIRNSFCFKKFKNNLLLNMTGPLAITKALKKLPIKKLVRCGKLTVLNYKIISPLAVIQTPNIPFELKRKSIEMLLKKKFYPETCMVHYFFSSHSAKTKTALTMNADELKQLLAEHSNPIRRIAEWLKIIKFLIVFEI